MNVDVRIFISFAANSLLLLLCMLVNSKLAAFSLYLLPIGPMLIIPALYLKYTSLVVCTLITGITIDACLPLTNGLFAYGLPIIGVLIRSTRSRFRIEDGYRLNLLAHLTNAACIILLYVSQSIQLAQFPDLMLLVHALSTTGLSHVVLIGVAPWFFSLEHCLFRLSNTETTIEDEFMLS